MTLVFLTTATDGFFPPFLLFNLHFRCEPEVSCVRGRTADYCSTLGLRSFISLMTESITFISHCHLPFPPPSAYNKKKEQSPREHGTRHAK